MLQDLNYIKKYLTNNLEFDFRGEEEEHPVPYRWSHGATDVHLGDGLIVYSIIQYMRAKVCVCLGSGGGFIPRLMTQSRYDLHTQGIFEGNADYNWGDIGTTYVVDAMNGIGGNVDWFAEESFYRRTFHPRIINTTTEEAFHNYFVLNDIKIDYLHIDAGHSYENVKEDFDLYSQILSENGIISIHDTDSKYADNYIVTNEIKDRGDHDDWSGPIQFVKELKDSKDWEVFNLFNFGIIKKQTIIYRINTHTKKMKKPRLITVTGHRTNTLRQMLSHYKDMVSEIHLVNYRTLDVNNKESFDRVNEIAEEFGCIVHERESDAFNWISVTHFYNEIKNLYPNDWWIVADDDELQLYWDDVNSIIEECEHNGWEFVTGGFIDKIGEDGSFPFVDENTDLWEAFPISSFFRYPMSGACPNKVTLCKGRIEVTSGQHYAQIEGQSTWRWQGWNHPLRYPIERGFTQVHHFKWDKSVVDRLKAVAKIGQDYSYSREYQIMLNGIEDYGYCIDLEKYKEFTWKSEKSFVSFSNWNKLSKHIVSI